MISTTSKQTGGTFLGLIIGLVIGLGIAVVVALMITKAPIPFLNKGAQPEKPVVPNASQLEDPNKSMYGNKDVAKEAARDFARDPAVAAKLDDDKAANKPANVIPAPAAGAAPGAAVPPAATAAADERYAYFLQAGAYRETGDAESTRARLALLGVEASISERASDSGILYRVRVGPFGQIDAMNKVRARLADNGMDVAVIRIAK